MVTSHGPAGGPVGTMAVMVEELTTVRLDNGKWALAEEEPEGHVRYPVVPDVPEAPMAKFEPEIVIAVPAAPDDGETEAMVGAGGAGMVNVNPFERVTEIDVEVTVGAGAGAGAGDGEGAGAGAGVGVGVGTGAGVGAGVGAGAVDVPTVSVMAEDCEAAKFASPAYVAVIASTPKGKLGVNQLSSKTGVSPQLACEPFTRMQSEPVGVAAPVGVPDGAVLV